MLIVKLKWKMLSIDLTLYCTLLCECFVLQDQLSLTVDALQPESVYRVEVQVQSEAGRGPSVAKTLHTPHVNGTLL